MWPAGPAGARAEHVWLYRGDAGAAARELVLQGYGQTCRAFAGHILLSCSNEERGFQPAPALVALQSALLDATQLANCFL